VPVLDDLPSLVHLVADGLVGEVFAQEDRPCDAPELIECLVGGAPGAAAGEPPQELLGFGGAEFQRGGLPDELVVVLGDQLPVDRAGGDDRRDR
jgi:hypothetical protein